ncbi:SPOR domain-containing protein [Treponema maltophilum]|uniref:SPOR domain-containing protein n=1 Tax=Treponema maltophilum TaxID=51160 RepID=UPI003D8FD800
MIQKTITKIAASVLFFLLFVSASKPSLDGRAVVAPQGELPPGLYVKSAAFLPGDTVLITNPAAKVSIEALVFASFSASDGIAVVLSPEAAKLLFIERGSNSIVQVTKNGGDMELSVLSKAYDALPLSEEPAVEAVGAIEDVQPDRPAEVAETDEVPAESASKKSELAEAQPAEAEEAPAESEEVTEDIVEVAAAPVAEEDSAEPEIPADSEDKNEETALAEVQPAETEEAPAEEVPAEIAAADEVPAESEEVTENIVEIAAARVAEEESAEPEIPAESEDKNEETELAEAQPAEAEEAPAEEVPAEIAAADEAPAESEEVTQEAEEPVNEPNVLITAEDNPPEHDESLFDEPIVETAVADDTDNTETLPDYFAHVQEVPQEVSAEPVPVETPHTKAIDSNAFAARNENLERYIIQNVREFGKGTYCIQLATYKDPANIAGFIEKYADKYPVRLASSERISGAYQVLIGPLNKDEYPVVLKRFVAWGFKDAFLREIR